MFTVQAWGSMEWTNIVRYLLKFIVAIAWMIIFPVTYSSSIKYPSGVGKIINSWIGNWYNQSVYNVAIVIYMIPNILAALFFLLPQLQNLMERSNSRAFVFLMWWIQVSLPYFFLFRQLIEALNIMCLHNVLPYLAKVVCWTCNARRYIVNT